jgi:hypothetical protein
MQMPCCIFYKSPDEQILFITVQTRGLTYKVRENPLRHEVSDGRRLAFGQQSKLIRSVETEVQPYFSSLFAFSVGYTMITWNAHYLNSSLYICKMAVLL